MDRRQGRRQVGVALVGDEDDRAGLCDRHVRARDANCRLDELLPQRLSRMQLDRLDSWLCAEHLGRVLFGEVDRRRDQVRGVGVRELDHALPEVRLHDLHAEALEVRVEADLFGRHRLALGHDHPLARRQTGGRVPAQLADDLSRLGRVLGEVDRAADGAEPFGELLQQLRQAVEVCLAPALQLRAPFGEVERLEGGVAPAAQAGHRVNQRLLQFGVVEGAVDAPREVAPSLSQK